jgi:hypothetical protein
MPDAFSVQAIALAAAIRMLPTFSAAARGFDPSFRDGTQ